MQMPPAQVAGFSLDRHAHACALFSSPDEEYAALAPFISEAIENGERTIILGNPDELPAHRDLMSRRGIGVADAEERGFLSLVDWNDAYLLDGHFDVDRMLGMIDTICAQAATVGFPRGRFIGHMEWALLDRPGVDQVIDFECRVNDVLARHGHPAICVYDVTRFDAATIVDILRTHPIVIMNGIAQENPFFLPPAEFIADRRSRSQAAATVVA
jgi:hypothetical protein